MRDWVVFDGYCNPDNAVRVSGLGPKYSLIVHAPGGMRNGLHDAISLVYRWLQNASISF